MSIIFLTKGYSTVIDDEDLLMVRKYHWCADVKEDGRVYARGRVDGKLVYLHRFLMNFPENLVDHKDLDTLNNQKMNLRIASHQQNSTNQKGKGSPQKGVRPNGDRFTARIKHQYCEIHLGTFDTAEQAAKAYDAKAIQLNGEFAKLNFPEVNNATEVGSNCGVPESEDSH